jgi:hypothetical protein
MAAWNRSTTGLLSCTKIPKLHKNVVGKRNYCAKPPRGGRRCYLRQMARFSGELWCLPAKPPQGYNIGGLSGGPMLMPTLTDQGIVWRFAGVIAEAAAGVLFEQIVAVRGIFIQPTG